MSRVTLSSIRSLTFYKGAETLARRAQPISQLTCIGKACKLYTPDAVRCQNMGGEGVEVDWKCEADLPEALRFGRVEVSCEGWSRPGDPYVLKGSCGLEYSLLEVPKVLRTQDSHISPPSWNISSIAFTILWMGFLLLILYSFVASCLRRDGTPRASGGSGNAPRTRPAGSGGWFPGWHPDPDPPPPYSYPKPDSRSATGWTPGFWTGAALGGLGASLFQQRRTADTNPPPTRSRMWDWERERYAPSWFGGGQSRAPDSDDRGEGSSRGASLGSMRRSTGFGGSTVR